MAIFYHAENYSALILGIINFYFDRIKLFNYKKLNKGQKKIKEKRRNSRKE